MGNKSIKEGENPENRGGNTGIPSIKETAEFYNGIAVRYDDTYSDLFWKLYDDLTVYFNEPYLPPANGTVKILDAGGGTGKWTVYYASKGYNVYCLDISEGMLRVAREKIKQKGLEERTEIIHGDVCKMDIFPDDFFDCVLALGDLLSHVPDDITALKEIRRVLKPGGRLICSADNRFVPIAGLLKKEEFNNVKRLTERKLYRFPGLPTMRYYLPSELEEVLKNAGFTDINLFGKIVIISVWPRKVRRRKLRLAYDFILDLEKKFGADCYFIGHANHLHAVCRKPSKGQ